MGKISVVMSVYNGEKYIFEAICSVLRQSFSDFEFIIVDDGSTDDTLSIIRSFKDKRIILLQNDHNFIKSLNLGLKKSTGKYVARMDADDIMHIDRLKIQHEIMEEEPEITVCSSWITSFGEGRISQVIPSLSGIIEEPLIKFVYNNFISHPTVLLRNDFLRSHNLKYENYPCAEDYKLWTKIAKLGGVFFMESQPLLFYRVSKHQVTIIHSEKMAETAFKIKKETIHDLIDRAELEKEQLYGTFNNLIKLESKGLVSKKSISNLFYEIFNQEKNLSL